MFWERLISLCKKNGISPSKLCEILNLSNATSVRWKKGSIPQDVTLKKIADYFDVSVEYLLGNTDIREKNHTDIELNEIEKKLILAYRNNPSMQEGVCRLLGIKYIAPVSGLTEASEEERIIYRAAMSSNNHEHQIEKRSKSDIAKLANAEKVTSEEDL